MADKLMYIPNDDTHTKNPFCRSIHDWYDRTINLMNQPNEKTILRQRIRERHCNLWGLE